jgi:hypothetical protein
MQGDSTFDDSGKLLLEEYYEPYKLRSNDARRTEGERWNETYTEFATDVEKAKFTTLMRVDQWTVEAVDTEIEVPAGKFRCVRVHRVSLETSSDKVYWFAAGVGKVKEKSGGQTEELVAYTRG